MIKTEYPYIDENGVAHNDLIKTYSDENKKLYQLQTAILYGSIVIDIYPCPYTYIEGDN